MSKLLYPKTKNGRVIIRNLPFDITIEELKTWAAQAAEVVELTLPTKADGKPRGFAFVQYSNKLTALKAIKKLNNTKVKGRKVAIDLALPTGMYKTQKEKKEETKKEEDKKEEKTTKEGGDKSDDKGKKEKEKEKKKHIAPDNNEEDLPNEEATEEPKIEKVKFDEDKTLFLRNVNYEVTKEELKKLLSKHGKIIYLALCKSKLTGECRGTAFVMYSTSESAQKVIKYSNGTDEERKQLEYKGKQIYAMKAMSKDTIKTVDSKTKENKHKRRVEEKKQKKKEKKQKRKLLQEKEKIE